MLIVIMVVCMFTFSLSIRLSIYLSHLVVMLVVMLVMRGYEDDRDYWCLFYLFGDLLLVMRCDGDG